MHGVARELHACNSRATRVPFGPKSVKTISFIRFSGNATRVQLLSFFFRSCTELHGVAFWSNFDSNVLILNHAPTCCLRCHGSATSFCVIAVVRSAHDHARHPHHCVGGVAPRVRGMHAWRQRSDRTLQQIVRVHRIGDPHGPYSACRGFKYRYRSM